MDTDSPHGRTHAVTRFHVDMPLLYGIGHPSRDID